MMWLNVVSERAPPGAAAWVPEHRICAVWMGPGKQVTARVLTPNGVGMIEMRVLGIATGEQIEARLRQFYFGKDNAAPAA